MDQELSEALDQCLILLDEGLGVDECLARYPEQAEELRPLLEVATDIRRVSPPKPSLTAFADGKRRMLEALSAKQEQPQQDLQTRLRAWIDSLFGERPQFQVALAAAAALLIFAIGGLLLYFWPGGRVAQVATLQAVEGTVEMLPAGSASWVVASSGEGVKPGDRIRTGALSTARLSFFEGSVSDLEPESEISISQMTSRRRGGGNRVIVRQWLGQAHYQVEALRDSASRFEVRTPTALAAVRGTAFAITVETDGTTTVEVEEGMVSVTSGGKTVDLQPGQMTMVYPDQTPGPPESITHQKPTDTPEPTETPGLTETPELTETPYPTETPELTETPEPSDTPAPTETRDPAVVTQTHQPPGLTMTPQPPGLTRTAQPPGLTQTHQPPGLTKTPQPPGQTKEPPGQEKKTPPANDGDDDKDKDNDNNGGGNEGGGGNSGGGNNKGGGGKDK